MPRPSSARAGSWRGPASRKIGGGDLHIAHALWGGALLFVGALLPLIWFGRRVHLAAAVLTGMGMGLFIDEVGKFITTRNDYFYPAAAPMIYSTFLLSVLLFLWIRRRPNDHGDGRRELASLLRGVADAAGARVSFLPDGGADPSLSSATLAARSVEPLTATFDLGHEAVPGIASPPSLKTDDRASSRCSLIALVA